jgi:hypothetical protein
MEVVKFPEVRYLPSFFQELKVTTLKDLNTIAKSYGVPVVKLQSQKCWFCVAGGLLWTVGHQ